MKRWAHDLHQIPEIGLKEYETTNYLINELKNMGYEPQQVTETGCYVYINQGKKETIAFRSDIDALPIHEQSCHPTPSTKPGYMHACGHDGHMAMLLGLANTLKTTKTNCNILLIFQPAEEEPGGAEMICKSGLLQKYNVTHIFGFHLSPAIEKGHIALRSGAMMAMCNEFDITIRGQSAHAGNPQDGIDTILIGSQLIQMYPTIITKKIKPSEFALIHVGEFHSGTARNIVSEQTVLKGTIRTFSEETSALIEAEMKKIHEAMMQVHGCIIEADIIPMYPPVINDSALSKYIFNHFEVEELTDPVMLAEDFSFYQKEVPGVFMFLGTKTNQHQASLHASDFYFEEDVLEIGLQTYLDILKAFPFIG